MTAKRAEALASKLLRDSGFRCLETPDGMLSSRGKFGGRRDDDHTRQAEGKRYTAWTTSVLWHGRFRTPFDRECWRLHSEGISREDSVPVLAVTYPGVTEYQIQVSVGATRGRYIGRGNGSDGTKGKLISRLKLRALIRAADTETLIGIAKVVLRKAAVNAGD